MADKISASITYLDASNNKGSKAITDISPTADNAAIKDFCIGLLGLTTNTLSQIDRVEKTDITNATPKPKLNLTLSEEDLSYMRLSTEDNFGKDGATSHLTDNLVTVPYSFVYSTENAMGEVFINVKKFSEFIALVISIPGGSSMVREDTQTEVMIYFDETETTVATTYKLQIFANANPVWTQL